MLGILCQTVGKLVVSKRGGAEVAEGYAEIEWVGVGYIETRNRAERDRLERSESPAGGPPEGGINRGGRGGMR